MPQQSHKSIQSKTRATSRPHARRPTQLRIAFLIDVAPRKLGSFEDWMIALVQEGARRGHRIDLFCRAPILPSLWTSFTRGGAGVRELDQLEGNLARASRMLAHHYDVVHLNLIAPRSGIALAAYAAWSTRLVFVDHVSSPAARPTGSAWGMRARLRGLLDRVTLIRVARIISVSDFVRRRLTARFRLPTWKVRTIYNGVDTDRFQPRALPHEAESPERRIEILAAAYLIEEKGIDLLLRALARLRADNYRVRIAGDGPELSGLRDLMESLSLSSRVTFLGLRDDVPELMREADIFVHPARWEEAFGLTVAEAMASGCAVIASETGALPELVIDNNTGLLVPANDEVALTETLERLLDDRELRASLAVRARSEVERRFSLDRCVAEHLDLCEEVALSS